MDHQQNSSTSSFKVWKPALALAALGFLAYSGLVRAGKVPFGSGVGPQQVNTVKVDRFFHGHGVEPLTVTVGSSLLERVRADYTSSKCYNLCLPNSSALTGLEVLLESRFRPRLIIVEIAYPLMLGSDAEALRRCRSREQRFIANNLPSLGQDHQLSNVFISKFKKRRFDETPFKATSATKLAIQKEVERRQNQLSATDQARFVQSLSRAKQIIAILKDRGARVLLADMRLEPEVEQAPGSIAIRKTYLEAFPESEYEWWRPLEGKIVQTTDGVHLPYPIANQLAREIVEMTSKL